MSDAKVIINVPARRSPAEEEITKFIFNLSKDLNIDGSQGAVGNDLELIVLVKNCKFLYDKKQPDFKEFGKRRAAWCAIATVLHSSVYDVQQRWKFLRDKFTKIKRELESGGDSLERVWDLYDSMKFMESYIKHRRSITPPNFEKHSENDSDENLKESNKTSEEHESQLLKLINFVKACPLIYDSRHPDHKNKEMKHNAWADIAELIGLPISECMEKWKYLKEKYDTERKSFHDPSSWIFMDHLSFLTEHMRKRRPSSLHLSSCTCSSSPTETSSTKMSHASPNFLSESDTNQIKEFHTESSIPTDRQILSDGSVNNGLNNSSDKSQPTITSSNLLFDEDDLFGKTISAELKLMPRSKKKMKLKADMYKLIYEAMNDD